MLARKAAWIVKELLVSLAGFFGVRLSDGKPNSQEEVVAE
jgi:hypothetical protein